MMIMKSYIHSTIKIKKNKEDIKHTNKLLSC